jgi:cellulose synthase/poly-beta-1,6-N-acetylglucosamine synthase-like glycosyltransferase
VVYLPLRHSGLPAFPRNKAILMSQGDFIAFLDSDDLWLPKKLEMCLSCFDSIPSLGLVCSNEFILQQNSALTSETLQVRNGKNCLIDFPELFIRNTISSSTAVVRRECLKTVGLFTESRDFRAVEDYHLWLRIAARYPVYYIDEPLGYYRIHEGSVRLNIEESLISLNNTLRDIYKQFPELITPFYSSAMKRIQSVEMAILKLYIRRRKIWKSLGWFFKFFKSLALDIR